jgi:hypothetical protein
MNSKVVFFSGLLVVLSGVLISCTELKTRENVNVEQQLVTSGFKVNPANTPEKLAHLKTLSQNKLVAHEKDGTTFYIYADATNCQCFFWGTEMSYQSFLKLQNTQNLAAQDRMSANMDKEEYLDWSTMGYGMEGAGYGFF